MRDHLISSKDQLFIQNAARYLEEPSFLVRVMDLIGKPLEEGLKLLPKSSQERLVKATRMALETSLKVAISTIRSREIARDFEEAVEKSYRIDWGHTLVASATGAAGGFFGLAALPVELPTTTTVMLRSIASIADGFGFDLSDPKVQLECLSVFSMGSPSELDNEMDSAYYSTRLALAEMVSEAAAFVARKTIQEVTEAVANKSAPLLIRFLGTIAARLEVVVSEKAMAQVIPVVGALSGAGVNAAFTDHFNQVARFHFGLKALEKRYGEKEVRELYRRQGMER